MQCKVLTLQPGQASTYLLLGIVIYIKDSITTIYLRNLLNPIR